MSPSPDSYPLKAAAFDILRYLEDHYHTSGNPIPRSRLRDAVGLPDEVFDAADELTLTDKLVGGTLGASGLRWITNSGVLNSGAQADRHNDRGVMLRAIELAKNCRSEPGNIPPKVAAIVVKDGVVIGEAYRGELALGEHAEYTLLERKLSDATVAGTTLFTTLEPCTHRNPPKVPCVERIIARRIKRVVIGTLDRNPKIRGVGETTLIDAGIEIARFDHDLIPVLEEMNREFLRSLHLRGASEVKASEEIPLGTTGPNGFPVSFNKEGDKVEWIEEEDGTRWPLILRRNDEAISREYQELWDQVWWNRHKVLVEKVENGEHINIPESAFAAAKRIEDKYGLENLGWDDVDWGILQGKMAALAWVLGSEWDESFDT